jgi:hypothetical protein
MSLVTKCRVAIGRRKAGGKQTPSGERSKRAESQPKHARIAGRAARLDFKPPKAKLKGIEPNILHASRGGKQTQKLEIVSSTR